MQGTLAIDGPFSLVAAANFGFGPQMARPKPQANTMAMAFVTDGLDRQAGVFVRQDRPDAISFTVFGEADGNAVQRQIARVLSLDRSGTAWLAAGERDPVLGSMQRDFPGLRPVLFFSPYEAAAWSVLSHRRNRAQSAAVRRSLSAEYGRVFELPDGPLEAFPTPRRLLDVDAFPGIEPTRMQHLHGIARAALEGRLDPNRLADMETEAALDELRRLPGIGPFYAGLILLRASGTADALTLREPHLAAYAAHFYGLKAGPNPAVELRRITDAWRPFRTWGVVLLRVAGDRAGLSFARR